ncbi:MAG: hypothetical protein JST00_24545 [Deltaproteobacteria bacterium]|nr:hypothetical protein [Deltaproteobacteria bacterium]
MRPTPSTLFVVAAIAVAAGVGVAARSARGAEDSSVSALPADAARLGFVVASEASGVALVDATQPFRIELGNGPVHGVPAGVERGRVAKGLVARELARYPQSFLRAIKLKGVVFTSELAEGENAIPSLPNVGGLLLFDVDASPRDLVRGLHHEIFHFADLADDGVLAPDPAWSELTPGFAYGAGGRTLRSAWAADGARDLRGFVTAYATSGVEEDKAETFAFAMSRRDELRARLPEDPVLAKKVDEVARRVRLLDAATDLRRIAGL